MVYLSANQRVTDRKGEQDIDFHNIMVNCYTFGPYRDRFIHALGKHRRGPGAFHCLMDFNRSLKFPSGKSLDACRLPGEAALVSATPYQPLDLNLAEHDYDPFAFDVACLGNMFRITYAVRHHSSNNCTSRRLILAVTLNRTSFPSSQCWPPFSTR